MNVVLLRRIIAGLLVVAIVLPIAIVLVLATGALLAGMGDEAGSIGLRYVALGLGLLWALCLVCLVLAAGLKTLDAPPTGGENEMEEFPSDEP